MRPATTILLVLLLSTSVIAATYHVAQNVPGASNENPGTMEQPWKTISKAAKTMGAGDKVIVHKGVYREWVCPKNSGKEGAPITYEAAKGEEVILTGADIFTDWKRVEGDKPIYQHSPWTLNSVVHGNPAPIGRQEQVICDGKLLKHVMTMKELKPGTFVSDIEKDVLTIRLPGDDSPAKHTIEVSVRNRCFGFRFREDGKDYIHVRGFIMRYGRNMAQRGILYVRGNHWVIEDNVIEWSNGNGFSLSGEHHLVRSNTMQYNGQLGMSGNPRNTRYENNKLLYNNQKGFGGGWENGGCKLVHIWNTVVSGTTAIGNDGPGIWLDIDNRNSIVEKSFCKDNTGAGIFVEISGKEGITVRNNVCVGNGLPKGKWGAAGILLGESENCTVEHNLCIGNKEGIAIRMQGPRGCGGLDKKPQIYFTQNHIIRNNIVAFNRDYQLVMHVDNPFFGPHPSPKVNQKAKFLIDPEFLKMTIDRNLYFESSAPSPDASRKRCLILYGAGWRRKSEQYFKLGDWKKAHSFDHDSQFADPLLVDWRNGDFRLKPDSPAIKMGAGLTEPVVGMREIVARE
ncbi:MAG: right-handed parallel beta-helix repeat-containing protein [Planctomycetes bacterium]|nr:right-handed parallel beta-helix repeat-containing protein [Planctomycetota bacterium]